MSAKDFANGASPLANLIGNLNERPFRTVEMPNHPETSVGLWVLTQTECDRAKRETFTYLRTVLKFTDTDLAYDPSVYDDNYAIELLAVALRDPEKPANQFAADGIELRNRLDPKTLGALYESYLAYVAECSPLRTAQDPEAEVDELVELLGKGQPVYAWCRRFDGPSRLRLLHTLAGRLATLMNAPSSPLSSPNASDPPSKDF